MWKKQRGEVVRDADKGVKISSSEVFADNEEDFVREVAKGARHLGFSGQGVYLCTGGGGHWAIL